MKNTQYIQIQGWMVNELGLKSNNLIVYSIIYGFSQDEKSKFTGSLKYLQETTGTSKNTVLTCLSNLVELGYLIKTEYMIRNVKLCDYSHNEGVVQKLVLGGAKNEQGVVQELTKGGAVSAPNNTINTITDIKLDKETVKSENDFTSSSLKTKTKIKSKDDYSDEVLKLTKEISLLFPEQITKFLSKSQKLNWVDTVDKLIRINKFSEEEIKNAVKSGLSDKFWSKQFKSLNKLRNKTKDDILFCSFFLTLDSQYNKQRSTGGANYESHIPTENDLI